MHQSHFKLGRYTIVKRIAIGGMAELFHAKVKDASGTERSVAIKRILPHYAANPEFRKMFESEAKLTNHLRHPNIVQTFDFTELGVTYLLEMELIDGVNLKQLTDRLRDTDERLTPQWAVYFVKHVCAGLDYAHQLKDEKTGEPLNIIHRDMSPQNIMISYEGEVKVVDFGIAKARVQADHTNTGIIKGKFAYMSPEQANGEKIDSQTDIFSLGISFWELLTGQRLFARDNDLLTLREVKGGVVPKPSTLNPDVPEELDAIVLKALARNKAERYQTAKELKTDLENFLTDYSPDFDPSHLKQHLMRIFGDFSPPVKAVPEAAKEIPGDIFYEASESSITCMNPTETSVVTTTPVDEREIESSISVIAPVISTYEPEKVKRTVKPLVSILAFIAGISGIFTAVYFLQNFHSLEKPVSQATFAASAMTLPKEPELSALKILVNEDVDLFIQDNQIAKATANVPVTLKLKGDQNHKIEFRNSKKGIRLSRNVEVKSGYVNRLEVSIE